MPCPSTRAEGHEEPQRYCVERLCVGRGQGPRLARHATSSKNAYASVGARAARFGTACDFVEKHLCVGRGQGCTHKTGQLRAAHDSGPTGRGYSHGPLNFKFAGNTDDGRVQRQ